DQGLEHRGIEGIQLLGTVQPDVGDAVGHLYVHAVGHGGGIGPADRRVKSATSWLRTLFEDAIGLVWQTGMRRIAFLCLLLSTAAWAGQVGGLPCRAVDPPLRRPLADAIGVNTHYGTDVDPGLDRFAAARPPLPPPPPPPTPLLPP